MDTLRPNEQETVFLELAYNRFYDIFDELMDDTFGERDEWTRFSKSAAGFAIYGEILNYDPVKWTIDAMKTLRPPMEAEISSELARFIRNTFAHFPFFQKWEDAWVSRKLVNWNKRNQSIDRFLSQDVGKKEVKYRFWEAAKSRMTYLTTNFPKTYNEDDQIYLRDIVSEKDGVKFCYILMKQIMDAQVESITS